MCTSRDPIVTVILAFLGDVCGTTTRIHRLTFMCRLSVDGANVTTLVNKAKSNNTTLLVVQDTNGAVFGALITEQLKWGRKRSITVMARSLCGASPLES